MLPPGHLAASYILVKSAEIFGFKVSLPETMLILAASVVFDFDLIVANRLKKSHHELITHTPFGVFLIWLVFVLLFGNYLSIMTRVLILASLFLHLLLDEISMRFYKLGWQQQSMWVEINWLYPFKKFKDHQKPEILKFSVISDYIRNAKVNVIMEILMVILAILIFNI